MLHVDFAVFEIAYVRLIVLRMIKNAPAILKIIFPVTFVIAAVGPEELSFTVAEAELDLADVAVAIVQDHSPVPMQLIIDPNTFIKLNFFLRFRVAIYHSFVHRMRKRNP